MELFVHVLFRRQGAARRNLHDVYTGDPFHPVEMDEGSQTAGAAPRREFDRPDVFHSEANYDRKLLLFHPLVVARVLE